MNISSYFFYLITAHTLFQGLYRVSSFSRAGVCFLSTAVSSLTLVSLFQRTSSCLSCPSPRRPSRVTRWLKLASKNSRFGCSLGKRAGESSTLWLCSHYSVSQIIEGDIIKEAFFDLNTLLSVILTLFCITM